MSSHMHLQYAGVPRLWRRDKRKHDQLEDVSHGADPGPSSSPSISVRASGSLHLDELLDAELDTNAPSPNVQRASGIPSSNVPPDAELNSTTSPSNAKGSSCGLTSAENAPCDESLACAAQASCTTDGDGMCPGSLVRVVPLIPPGADGRAVKERLKAEGVSETELGDLLPAAINNYAHFYGKRRSEVNLHKVVFTSAGLRGWASADLGYAEKVLTVHFTSEDSDGDTVIACTSPGGITSKLTVTRDTTVAMVRTSLADQFSIQSDLLQLVLPDSRLLTGSEADKPILQSRPVPCAPVAVSQDSELSRWQRMLWQKSGTQAGMESLDNSGKRLDPLVTEQCLVSIKPCSSSCYRGLGFKQSL